MPPKGYEAITVEKAVYEHLEALRQLWGMKSINEVIKRLVGRR